MKGWIDAEKVSFQDREEKTDFETDKKKINQTEANLLPLKEQVKTLELAKIKQK